MRSRSGEKSARWSPEIRAREHELLARLAATPLDDPQRARLRDDLVTMNLPLVEHLARRFRDRGESRDDLVQVGTVGLINAVDRFDTSRGVEFSTFATPTIVGEIKRYFRDKGWAVKVPRRLQELRLAIVRSSAELAQKSGSSPTVAELAAELKISEEEVLEGLESAQAYATSSLDAGSSDPDESATLSDTLGTDDKDLEGVDNRESLKPLLAALPERERRILLLRFFDNKTQSEIAEEIGISQMHVSRLLGSTLADLREGLLDEY
ncbi:MAG: RNA polymerase sigma factor SigF [Candidatus Nanopelagicales bacterium]|nr:RNA polymerase sigma factor SigF [Candidatus Nanopelagicales bacterium]